VRVDGSHRRPQAMRFPFAAESEEHIDQEQPVVEPEDAGLGAGVVKPFLGLMKARLGGLESPPMSQTHGPQVEHQRRASRVARVAHVCIPVSGVAKSVLDRSSDLPFSDPTGREVGRDDRVVTDEAGLHAQLGGPLQCR